MPNDLTGTPVYTTTSPKFGTAAWDSGVLSSPTGIASFLTAAPPVTGNAIGTGTLEAWVRTTASGAVQVAVGSAAVWWIGISAGNKAQAAIGGGANIVGTTNINDGNWHHLALVVTAGVGKLYVDGALEATDGAARTVGNSPVNYLAIGSFNTSGSFLWGGDVDEVRMSSTARYTAGFTAPTAAFTDDADTVALWHLDSSGADAHGTAPAAPVGNIVPNDGNLVFSPYNWEVTSSRAFTNCAGAYLRTLIGGTPTAITLNFDAAAMDATNPTRLWYRIDGGSWTQATIAATVALTLPGSPVGPRRLVELVVKTTTESANRWASPYATAVKLTGITTAPSSCTTVAVQTRSLRGVVFGDSITEGINTIGTSGDTTTRSDALYSYAYQLADALGAEVGVVGFGSQGLARGGNGSVPTVESAWNLQAANITRTFSPAPDFVVINEGQNNGVTDITAAYTGLLNAILTALPSTRIFAVRPFTGLQAANITAAVAACSAPSRVTYVDTTGWWTTTDSADSVHPYWYAARTSLSPRLAAAIRSAIGGGGGGSGRYINVGGVANLVGTVIKS